MQFRPSEFSTSLALSNPSSLVQTRSRAVANLAVRSPDSYAKLVQAFMDLLAAEAADLQRVDALKDLTYLADFKQKMTALLKQASVGSQVSDFTGTKVMGLPLRIENRYAILEAWAKKLKLPELIKATDNAKRNNQSFDGFSRVVTADKSQAANRIVSLDEASLAKLRKGTSVTKASAKAAIVAELNQMHGPMSKTAQFRDVQGSGGYKYRQLANGEVFILESPAPAKKSKAGGSSPAKQQDEVMPEVETPADKADESQDDKPVPDEGKGINWWLVAGIGVPLVLGVAAIVYFRTSKSESPSLPLVPAPA